MNKKALDANELLCEIHENGEKTAAQLLKSMSRLTGPSRAE